MPRLYDQRLSPNEKIVFSDVNLNAQSIAGGDIVYNTESVINQMFTVWGTTPGERFMLRTFGCDVMQYLFDPVDPQTAMKIRYELRESLVWVPEISVDPRNVNVYEDLTLPGYYTKVSFSIPKLDDQLYEVDFGLSLALNVARQN